MRRVTVANFTESICRFVDHQSSNALSDYIRDSILQAIERSLQIHPDWKMSETTKQACVDFAMARHKENVNRKYGFK